MTNGEILYRYHHPPTLLVVEFSKRNFARAEDAFYVPNPANPTPWRFLTEKCRQSYERQAVGHHLFCKAET